MARKILMNVAEGDECRIAVLENGKLFEFFIDRPSQLKHVGNIYKAVINNIEPGIQAAFVDIGLERNGFLHVSDVNYAYQNSPDLASLFSKTLRIKESLADEVIFESDKERDVEEVEEFVGDGSGTGAESRNGADEAEFLDKLDEEQHGHPVTASPLEVEVPEGEPPTPEEQTEGKSKDGAAEEGSGQAESKRRRRRPRRRGKGKREAETGKAEEARTGTAPSEKPAEDKPAGTKSPQDKPAEEKPKLLPGQGPRRAETEQADKARQEDAQKQLAASGESAQAKSARKRRRTPKKRGGKLPKRVLENDDKPADKPDTNDSGGSGGGPVPGPTMRFHRGPQPTIQSILKRGQEVAVQVAKASQGGKGPGLTTFVSLPGRYMVLTPNTNRGGVSRKIEDGKARGELRKMLDKLPVPEGMGVIIRTAAINRTFDDLLRDLNYLLRVWSVIVERVHEAKAPALLYSDSDPAIRTVRDYFTADTEEIVIDDREVYERVLAFFDQLMPSFRERVKLYEGEVPLFFETGMETQIDHIFDKRVPLKSGGYLFIEQTEALVSIDVNSGKFTSAGDAEKTAFLTNKEAIPEICRQLRLRDLAGIVCCDLIDMSTSRHRTDIEQTLRRELRKDRARTKVAKMSPFGVIEMTRQRVRPSIKNYNYVDCPTCAGFGMVRSAETMCLQLIRRMKLALVEERVTELAVQVHPHVLSHLHSEFREDIDDLEEEYDKRIVFEYARDLVLGQTRIFYINDRGNRVLYDIDQRINSFLKGGAPKSKSNVVVPEGASGAASPAVLAAQKGDKKSKRRRRGGRRQREKESARREREERIKAEGEKAVTFGDTLPAANVEVVSKEDKKDERKSGKESPSSKKKRRRGRRGGRKAREREGRKEGKEKSDKSSEKTKRSAASRGKKESEKKSAEKTEKKPARRTKEEATKNEKKPVTKKAAPKKAPAKKTEASSGQSAKRTNRKSRAATRGTAGGTTKKSTAKKTTTKKTATKKAGGTTKKPATRKTAAKKAPAKKTTTKKAATKKAAPKKASTAKKKPATKKTATTKKAAPKKAATTKKASTTKGKPAASPGQSAKRTNRKSRAATRGAAGGAKKKPATKKTAAKKPARKKAATKKK